MLANLAGVVGPCTAGVALHFDHCLPPGDTFKCETQVFTFRLVLPHACIHIADCEPEVRKHLLDCGSQVIAVGPESSPRPTIGSLSFKSQFRLKLFSFGIQPFELRFDLRNLIC